MPELTEEMYCSQQICIPPSFPYILRQYAKAAIRSQPIDLLRWSTAYFRCLALNIPPPVKTRLEYPIPRDYFGLTPGWIRVLLTQFHKAKTITFKVLWEHWTGACLKYDNLIQVLCLGNFTDPKNIKLLHFIGLCAGHLTDNLTQTMILICEILTEEPEGGSSMITVEDFLETYVFLAKIDCSQPLNIKNRFFTDSLLSLIEKEKEGVKLLKKGKLDQEGRLDILLSEEESSIDDKKFDDLGSMISCPSIQQDDIPPIENYLKTIEKSLAAGEDFISPKFISDMKEVKTESDDLSTEESKSQIKDDDANKVLKDDLENIECNENEEKKDDRYPDKEESKKMDEPEKLEEKPVTITVESVDTITEIPKKNIQEEPFVDTTTPLVVDDNLKEEVPGEVEDYDIERLKMGIMVAYPTLTQSQVNVLSDIIKMGDGQEEEGTIYDVGVVEEIGMEDKYQDVYIDVIPGIGPKVPENLIEAVCTYMREMAKKQHGMVMPRNIRHYSCPPLEVIDDYLY